MLDTALQDLLGGMANEACLQLQAPSDDDGQRPFGSGRRISEDGVRELIQTSLPSLTKRFGEGTLHRDIALFYAESLEEEASRFYRMAAEQPHESKNRERGKLRFLREVVLQS